MSKNNKKIKTVAQYAASLEITDLLLEIANNPVIASTSFNDELYVHILKNELKSRN